MSKSTPAALGFRVKSGWAAAVLLVGPARSPQVVDAREVALSDPDVPESRQPYHAAMGMLEEDTAKVRQRTKIVERAAAASISNLLENSPATDYGLRGAALVIGSQADPEKITNTHIRAHALEGKLFRTVLEETLRAHGLMCALMPERDLYAKASALLGHPADELKRLVTELRRRRDGPWRADQKMAALAAWMLLD